MGQLEDFGSLKEEPAVALERSEVESHHYKKELKPNSTAYLAFIAKQLVEFTTEPAELKYNFTPPAVELAVMESESCLIVVRFNVTFMTAVEAIELADNRYYFEPGLHEMACLNYFHP